MGVLRGIPPRSTASSHPPDRVIRGPGPVPTVRSVATHWRPSPDRPQVPRAYRTVGPKHDRVRLTPAELRVVSELERALPRTGGGRRRLRRPMHAATLALAPLLRWAPWLFPVGVAVMVLFISTSVAISFLGAALTACGMAALVNRGVRRLRDRGIRRRSGAQPPG